MSEDIDHLECSAAAERLTAMRSAHLTARAAHLEMARQDQELLDAISRRAVSTRLDVAGAAWQ